MKKVLIIVIFLALIFANIIIGGLDLTLTETLDFFKSPNGGKILELRLIKILVAILAGAGISVSGLLMQTLFKNPLAGPYVLGVSSGASLGAAIFVLILPMFWGIGGLPIISNIGLVGFAWIGAILIQLLIGLFSRKVNNIMTVLIIGLMLGSGVGAIVQLFQFLSDEAALKSYILWTFGSLSGVTASQSIVLIITTIIGLAIAILSTKGLNLLLLGEDYAKTLGINTKKIINLCFISTSLLAGTVTAFCGPIAFIGIVIPYIARMISKSADHKVLIPLTASIGAITLLGCNLASNTLTIPINILSSLLGIPIVIWIVIKNKKLC